MSEKHKLPDNIGKLIQGKLPEIKKDYDLMGNEVYSIVDKAIISMQENIDDKLCEHIRQVAMDNGIDTVYVMDKKVITKALTKQLEAKKPKVFGDGDIKARFCAECGTVVLKDQKYCFNCGQKLDWED